MKRKLRRWKMWGGFVDDKLRVEWVEDNYGESRQPAIYLSRSMTRKRFKDVRRVEVRELSRKIKP